MTSNIKQETIKIPVLDRIIWFLIGAVFSVFTIVFCLLPFVVMPSLETWWGRIIAVLLGVIMIPLMFLSVEQTYVYFRGYRLINEAPGNFSRSTYRLVEYIIQLYLDAPEIIAKNILLRYLLAAFFVWQGYSSIGMKDNEWFMPILWLAWAAIFAAELSIILLAIGLFFFIIWLMYLGIKALPVSIAIIIGAIIIASAIGIRK